MSICDIYYEQLLLARKPTYKTMVTLFVTCNIVYCAVVYSLLCEMNLN